LKERKIEHLSFAFSSLPFLVTGLVLLLLHQPQKPLPHPLLCTSDPPHLFHSIVHHPFLYTPKLHALEVQHLPKLLCRKRDLAWTPPPYDVHPLYLALSQDGEDRFGDVRLVERRGRRFEEDPSTVESDVPLADDRHMLCVLEVRLEMSVGRVAVVPADESEGGEDVCERGWGGGGTRDVREGGGEGGAVGEEEVGVVWEEG
jgi:hypothetical protein